MKMRTMALTLAASMLLSVSVFAAQTVTFTLPDGSGREENEFPTVSVSNITEAKQDEYGWTRYYAEAPVTVKVLSPDKLTQVNVLTRADFDTLYWDGNEAMNEESFKSDQNEYTLADAGKYVVFCTDDSFEDIIDVLITGTAAPSSAKVLVNGTEVAFDAYTIAGNTYFKLRDVAKVVSGTEKQFEVTWDNVKKAINLVSHTAYTETGSELAKGDGTAKSASPNMAEIYKDGEWADFTSFNIGGNTYFKLRDLGQAFDFHVGWDGTNKCITIDTAKSYQ